jgi:hypothetical protein
MNTFHQIGAQNYAHIINDPTTSLILEITVIVWMVILALLVISFYVYFALALQTIAKKQEYKKHWLSWIPVANLFLFPILSGRNWNWGWLFFIPVVNIILLIICFWEILEKNGFNGKWSLILLGSFIAATPHIISTLGFLVILGIVAWKKK